MGETNFMEGEKKGKEGAEPIDLRQAEANGVNTVSSSFFTNGDGSQVL